MDALITCPGCRQPLKVPAAAVGKPGRCPHCRAAFFVPADPDGRPGEARPAAARRPIPRGLAVPAFAVLVLGLAGTLVNGYLAVLCELRPENQAAYARGMVFQARAIEEQYAGPKPEDWPYAPAAAVAGAAAAGRTRDLYDDELTAAWAPGVKPVMWQFAAVSVVEVLGGVAIFRGRWYWLAALGCVAAVANVNHLCCIPGTLVGVWGLLALFRDEGRMYFRSG